VGLRYVNVGILVGDLEAASLLAGCICDVCLKIN